MRQGLPDVAAHVAAFFKVAKPILAGEVNLPTCDQVSAKQRNGPAGTLR